MDESNAPAGWHTQDVTPSGLHRLLPDDYTVDEPHRVNLAHNRVPVNQFIINAWMLGWIAFVGCAIGYGMWLYLGSR